MICVKCRENEILSDNDLCDDCLEEELFFEQLDVLESEIPDAEKCVELEDNIDYYEYADSAE